MQRYSANAHHSECLTHGQFAQKLKLIKEDLRKEELARSTTPSRPTASGGNWDRFIYVAGVVGLTGLACYTIYEGPSLLERGFTKKVRSSQ